jgi:hypothetical protein
MMGRQIVSNFRIVFNDGRLLEAPLVHQIKDYIGLETPKMVVYLGLDYFTSSGVAFQVEVWQVDNQTVMANIINSENKSALN